MEEPPRRRGFDGLSGMWSRRRGQVFVAFALPFPMVVAAAEFLPGVSRATATVIVEREEVQESFVKPTMRSELREQMRRDITADFKELDPAGGWRGDLLRPGRPAARSTAGGRGGQRACGLLRAAEHQQRPAPGRQHHEFPRGAARGKEMCTSPPNRYEDARMAESMRQVCKGERFRILDPAGQGSLAERLGMTRRPFRPVQPEEPRGGDRG